MAARPAGDELRDVAEIPELLDTGARMRSDTESLLLLTGHDPGVRATGPRRLDELMGDAAALLEEPRVAVGGAPDAMLGSAAALEFLHVLTEVVDHTATAHPAAHLEMVGRVESGGVTVDVLVDGPPHADPDSAAASAAAEQLAQRSRHGIAVHRPLGGPPPSGAGLVASVHCPPAAVTVTEPDVLNARTNPRNQAYPGLGNGLGNGSGNGLGGGLDTASGNGLGNGLGNGPLGNGLGLGSWTGGLGTGPPNGNGLGNGHGNGNGHAPLDAPSAPAYSPSSSSQVDELFGPLLDLPLEPLDDRYATPIFEAIASAWFRAGETGRPAEGGPLDWETPQDSEWREAAARAARSDAEPGPTTATGLPRRRPGNQLVPPPRSQSGLPSGGAGERVPDRVRDRLSTYQRGLRQGRHRAPNEDVGGSEEW
ncbi:hypothetical protein BJF78_02830 [Pseudonocardia sp. CNS-139]|nr:hypothetical protein BJF78_02830 [Pseudonocardia sp. CNS-139]